MGKKRILITTLLGSSLLFAAGFTAFKGINSGINKVVANEDTVTVYLDISSQITKQDGSDGLYWDDANALVNLYYQGGSYSSDTYGETMTKVMTGVYSLEIPSDTTEINVFRIDPYSPTTIWNRAVNDPFYIPFTTDITTNNIYKLVHYNVQD